MHHRFRYSLLLLLLLALFSGLLNGCRGSSTVVHSTQTPGLWTIDAGALKLEVQADPWRANFLDAAGKPLLSESSASGLGPIGTLGLSLGPPPDGDGVLPMLPPLILGQPEAPLTRATGWIRATRLTDAHYETDGTWVGTLATTSPLHSIELQAKADGDGIIRLTARATDPLLVQAMGIGFEGSTDERYFGFGQRSNAVTQGDRVLEHYVGEGPYQDEEYPFIIAAVPKWGIRWRKDASSFPIPWLLSSRGYGVLLDNDELSYHRLESNAWSVEAESAELRLRIFAGPTPAKTLERFSAAVGRQPNKLSPWFLGPWVQLENITNINRLKELRAADVPTSVAHMTTSYLPCGDQQGTEDVQRQTTRDYKDLGVAVTTYFNPMICRSYQPAFDEMSAQDALIKNRLGETYTFPYVARTVFLVSQFDFGSPNGITGYKKLTDEAISHGYEGWMEDFGEYTPLDAVSGLDGKAGTVFHNRFPREYHCGVNTATADAGKPLARFARSGWTGSAACSPMVWGGDPSVSFNYDGLESSIYQALSMGTSGVGLWGSDIGGFMALGLRELSPELLDRWIAFGAMTPFMRHQASNLAIPPGKSRPQIWDPEHLPIWRRYAKLHTQLYPYLRAAADEYYATGMPIMRHHIFSHPNDSQAVARDDQYMFGPDLLVAPIYQQGATTRELYLPRGRWVEFWRAVDYVDVTGDFVLRPDATVIEGGRSITVNAPIEEIPIFVRAGARIPLLPADTYTLADHGTDPSIIHLKDRQDRIRTLTFPN